MAVTRDQVAKLYVANFNRAPDAAGLDYWISDGTSATTTLTDLNAIAASMQAGAEASTGVASMTDSAYVVSLYSSMFGRTVAADSADVTYWTAEITAGNVTRANMIQTLILGAEASTGSATDAAVLANKTEVGLYYADTLGLDDADFSLVTVTDDDATVTTAKADADTYVPVSLSLTTGTDTLTGSKGDDTFTAAVLTANDGDILAGGEGSDVLNLETASSITSNFKTSSIETVNLNALGAISVDMTNKTGVTAFNSNDAAGAVTVNNIAATAATYGVKGAATNNLTLNYATAVLNGSADKLNVKLNG